VFKNHIPSFKQLKLLRQRAESSVNQDLKTQIQNQYEISELIHELSIHQIELEMQNEELCLAQAELEQSRSKYIDLYDFAPLSYITLNKNKKILAVNFAGSTLLGMERSRLCKQSIINFISADSREVFDNHINQLMLSRKKQMCEVELIQEGGGKFYVQIESTLHKDNTIHTILTDITARKHAELKLLKINKSLHLVNNLFQNAGDAMAALDKEFRFIIFNNAFRCAFTKIFAYKITLGANFLNILADFPELQDKIIKACTRAFLGADISILNENTTGGNEAYYCYEIRFSPIYNEDSASKNLIFLIRDITEYKLNEKKKLKKHAEFARLAKMTSVGEMASAFAHEINQPLAAISAYCRGSLLRLETGKADENQLQTAIQKMAVLVDHAGKITQRMIHFVRKGIFFPEHVDINKLISDALLFFNDEMDDIKLKINLQLSENLPNLFIDKLQITQVILNLTRNSIEAMQEARVSIFELTVQTSMEDDKVVVDIIDNGPGIGLEIADKILNSYFTTKPQGTGLGLAICRTIVEEHGGKLIVKPCTFGAWVQFNLPIV